MRLNNQFLPIFRFLRMKAAMSRVFSMVLLGLLSVGTGHVYAGEPMSALGFERLWLRSCDVAVGLACEKEQRSKISANASKARLYCTQYGKSLQPSHKQLNENFIIANACRQGLKFYGEVFAQEKLAGALEERCIEVSTSGGPPRNIMVPIARDGSY